MLHALCRNRKEASVFGAFFVWILFFPTWAQARSECTADHIDEWSKVEYIYDGDTLRLSDQRIIRFIAINAPELAHKQRSAQPLAEEARQALVRMLPVGSRVGLRYDKERHDVHHRVLAHVFAGDGQNVSAALLRLGYAFAIAVPPNLWASSCYFRQETTAQQQHLGIWAEPAYRPKSAAKLDIREGGFYRVSGQVEHIGKARHSIWLDMGRHFAVRIPRKQLQYFTASPPDALLGRQITVRGWARFYNDKLRMTLMHPAMIESAR